MKKPRSKKKIIISVLCVLLALAVLTPCVINAVVMLSASKYIISADEAAGAGRTAYWCSAQRSTPTAR